MALPKINWSGIWESVKKHKTIWLIVVLAIVLALLAFFISDRVSDALFKRSIQKQKDAIAAKIEEAKAKEREIDIAEAKRDQLRGEITAEIKQLAEDIQAHEELRKEANQALANYNAAVNSNSNVNRSADDLKKILERLEEQP